MQRKLNRDTKPKRERSFHEGQPRQAKLKCQEGLKSFKCNRKKEGKEETAPSATETDVLSNQVSEKPKSPKDSGKVRSQEVSICFCFLSFLASYSWFLVNTSLPPSLSQERPLAKLLNECSSENDLSDDNSNPGNNNETNKTSEPRDTIEVGVDLENLPEDEDDDWLKSDDDVDSDSSSEDYNNLTEEEKEQLAKVRSFKYIFLWRKVWGRVR